MRRRHHARAALSSIAVLVAVSSEQVAHAEEPRGDRGRPGDHAGGEPAWKQADGGSPYSNALRIARMVHDEGLIARLLTMHGMGKSATEADLLAVIAAYEAAGTPQPAIEFLRWRIRQYPDDRRSYVLLAQLLARGGYSRQAVAAWHQHIQRFGFEALSFEEGHRYARDLSRTGDVGTAYTTLLGLRSRVPEGALEYWTDLAVLAWDRDDAEVALTAYENVYRLEPKTLHAGARLMTLLAEAKRRDEAVRVAMAEHRRTEDTSAVVFAAQLLANDGDWLALWAVIQEAERAPGALHERADYLLLRGDTAKHLGDLAEASSAYRAALAVAPDDPIVRASALWTAIELGDSRQVGIYVDRFREGTRDQPELWLPMAHGLASIGRPGEAVVWFSLQLKTTPQDARLLLDLGDALAILGRETLADTLRRRAVSRLQKEVAAAVRSPQPTEDERHLIESTALALRVHAGVPRADPWMSVLVSPSRRAHSRPALTMRRTMAGSARTEDDLAADWYLTTGRPEYARRIVARNAPGTQRKQRLALALLDGDPSQTRALLTDATELSPEDRAHGLLALERDRDAIRVIGDALERAPNGPDAPAMADELARLALIHRPNVRVGGTYSHITGLDIVGPQVAASHDAIGGRLSYFASGSRMTDPTRQLLITGSQYEAEAGASLRVSSLRSVSEVTAAVDYQTGSPVARGGVFDHRPLTRRLAITTEVRAGSRIFDTSFLRVAAVRNLVSVGLRYDLTRWYASAELEGREEHTRSYEHLAWDGLATAETGVKVLTRAPHLAVGAQAQASQRDYPTRFPGVVTTLVSPNVSLPNALPPSFQLVGGVVHLSRGDISERARADLSVFPRYDCEAAFGALLPDTDTAVHLLCGASVRMHGGYTTLLAFYNRGVAGVRNNENAELALSYTAPF